jgi:hypothetical protein
LVGRRAGEKYKAMEQLKLAPTRVDRPLLRKLLLDAIEGDFSVAREKKLHDRSIGKVRSWLLAALGKVADDDPAAHATVIKHVFQEDEPYEWTRYWALESVVTRADPKATEIAKKVAERDEHPMVRTLAYAYLAQEDEKALAFMRESLGDRATQWFALRALRELPLHATVDAVCDIIIGGEYSDETYDAIMALGAVPVDWNEAERCAQTLSSCIGSMRDSAWKDGMRTGAIRGLGNLKLESTGPLLIEELADDNPAIVREAARACEKVLGIKTTVMRVVEAADKGGGATIEPFGRALRWLDRSAVANELETLMTAGSPTQQELARAMLRELGGMVAFEKLRVQRASIQQYTEFLDKAEAKIRGLFEETVHEGQRGFKLATWMDMVVFGAGLLLIAATAINAMIRGNVDFWAGVGLPGGVGVLGVLYGMLISNPRRQVRNSVDHLMRIKIVFLAYLRRLHQADQAYTRRLLDNEPVTSTELKEFSEILGGIMAATIKELPVTSER